LTGTARHAGEVGLIDPQGHLGLLEGATALTAFDAGQMFTKSVAIRLELMFTRALFATADTTARHRLLKRRGGGHGRARGVAD
jgi:hypothetical protein